MSREGRLIEIWVNGAVVAALDTEDAVAADYVSLMSSLSQAMMHEPSMEKEANASGKTITHRYFRSLGSLPITNPKDPQ